MFVGRERELAWLEREYAARASAFVPIYGRRRVGKTALIRKFAAQRPAIFHVGKTAPAAAQQREFLAQTARVLDDPLIARLPPDDWGAALDAIDRHTRADKLIVVFDEFQWTAQASPELPSLLQERWDLRWRDSGRVFLIICGSYIGFMEREVLGRKSPLFGRRTGQILLRPFSHREAAQFHPRWSTTDRAIAYFVCGGVPAYLRYFDDARSVELNLRDQIFDPASAMHREPEFLLREELREVERYYAVLVALAGGAVTMKDISASTGIGERTLYYYVQQLVELGYVERRSPLVERRRAPARRSRVAIRDPLLRFWFRFLFPEQSRLEQVGAVEFFRERVKPRLDAYWGRCFERLCREALPALYASEGVAGSWEVGEYWDKHVQIDVVGLRDDGWTDLGECKWGAVRSPRGLARELDTKRARFPNQRGASIGMRAFTRKKPRHVDERVRWHDLDDLYR